MIIHLIIVALGLSNLIVAVTRTTKTTHKPTHWLLIASALSVVDVIVAVVLHYLSIILTVAQHVLFPMSPLNMIFLPLNAKSPVLLPFVLQTYFAILQFWICEHIFNIRTININMISTILIPLIIYRNFSRSIS